MDEQIMERDSQGKLHAVIDTIVGAHASFNITACGSLFSKDRESIVYDAATTEPMCKVCAHHAHKEWCDGLSPDEIRKREASR